MPSTEDRFGSVSSESACARTATAEDERCALKKRRGAASEADGRPSRAADEERGGFEKRLASFTEGGKRSQDLPRLSAGGCSLGMGKSSGLLAGLCSAPSLAGGVSAGCVSRNGSDASERCDPLSSDATCGAPAQSKELEGRAPTAACGVTIRCAAALPWGCVRPREVSEASVVAGLHDGGSMAF